ncbi:hypothetical protein ABMY20_15360 [Tenacibaculum sp. SSH1-16]|uniref:hypothetical protein n=1 Tax=Tenacibaculum sp. SSH1-16 TaxID=3136667 RepID=UPI0032C41C2E|nr:hypothetical protein BACY1_20920 [Tenacibaculum mesophilum]
MDLNIYFKNLLPGSKTYLPGNKIVDLSKLPADSLELYLTGFPHIGLKPEAVELFKKNKIPVSKLKELIELKIAQKNKTDVKLLKSLLPKK